MCICISDCQPLLQWTLATCAHKFKIRPDHNLRIKSFPGHFTALGATATPHSFVHSFIHSHTHSVIHSPSQPFISICRWAAAWNAAERPKYAKIIQPSACSAWEIGHWATARRSLRLLVATSNISRVKCLSGARDWQTPPAEAEADADAEAEVHATF